MPRLQSAYSLNVGAQKIYEDSCCVMIIKAHLHKSESDVTSNLLHCFPSVYLYYSDKEQRRKRKIAFTFALI